MIRSKGVLKGPPQFMPWQEDPDPADHWEEADYQDMRRRLRAYWNGDDINDALRQWSEEKHVRNAEGEFGTNAPNRRAKIASSSKRAVAALKRAKPTKDDSITVNLNGRDITFTKPLRARNDHLVLIDVTKFDQAFARQRYEYVGPGGTQNAIGKRYAGVSKYISENNTIEASEVHFNEDGSVAFTNGRHRYAALRDAGLKEMPMALTPEALKNALANGYVIEDEKPPVEEMLPKGTGRAPSGGGIAETNQYYYKGGQFLPITEAPPGTWRIKVKGKASNIENKSLMIEPGKFDLQPTPFSLPVYGAMGGGTYVNIDNGVASLNPRVNWDYVGSPDEKRPLRYKHLATSSEEYSTRDLVELYNQGVRWIDLEPNKDVEVVAKAPPTVELRAKKMKGTEKAFELPKGRVEMIERVASEVAVEFGIDPSTVKVDKSQKYLNTGQDKNIAAADANLGTLQITVYPHNVWPGLMQTPEQAVRGTLVHEIGHVRYQTMMNTYIEQVKAGRTGEIYDKMRPFHEGNYLDRLVKDDGVTEYSKGFWEGYGKDEVKLNIALHETIAEMMRVKDKTKQLKGSPDWQAYYQAVMESYDMITGKQHKS
jgi:hypothetical protein